jgi:hypothetical protein
MNYLIKTTLLYCLIFLLCSCNSSGGAAAWDTFKTCDGRGCVKEVLAVKNALLANPQSMLTLFNETYEQGEDHVIGWLYLLRDSVLLNPSFGSIEKRLVLQQKIIKAVKLYEDHPVVGEMAKSVLGEMESFSIQSEKDELSLEALPPSTGTYVQTLSKNAGSLELLIAQTSVDSFRFLLKLSQNSTPSQVKSFAGKAIINQQEAQAIYISNTTGATCKLRFDFSENAVSVKTITGSTETCGFGQGMAIEGSYRRKSFADPFLSQLDAKKMASLLGEWQSTDDPRAKIKIADGRYQDWYDELPVETFLYVYYPNCPSDCKPKNRTSCLKIMGQDEACYTILKIDDNNLVLSPIGGSGKPNNYVRLTE